MLYIFLKAIIRAIQIEIEIVYVDGTGCFLQKNNYRDWVSEEDTIIKGAKTKLKEKINIIMAINSKEVLYYKAVNSNVNAAEFAAFIKELCQILNTHLKKLINSYGQGKLL